MLVDDHSIMRDLLRDALENTGEYRVVAQAADGAEALRMVEEIAPEVIVMDVIMPVMDGIEACREIMDKLPDTRVLMLTASNEQESCGKVHRRRGHRVSPEVFGQGAVADHPAGGGPGGVPHSGERGPAVVPGGAQRAGRGRLRAVEGELTEREREILKLFAQGLSYQEIGEIRGISALTVRNAMSGIQRKLEFRTRQQLVVWAVRIRIGGRSANREPAPSVERE